MLQFEYEISRTGLGTQALGSQMVALFGKIVEHFGGGSFLEETQH